MADDPLIEAVAERLRRPVPLSARVEEGALARLRNAGRGGGPSRRPGSALGGLAIAAGLAGLFTAGVLVGRHFPAGVSADGVTVTSPSPGMARPTAAAGGPAIDTVDFVLRTAAESGVVLVGDFNDWDPAATPLQRVADGVWAVTMPLRPGRYRYTFIVDGARWLRDPSSPPALEDDFGAPTSVITIARR
jgi:hypothetical protein